MKKETNLRHNCCKECSFEWISIDPLGNSADRLVCKICKREFIDTIFIKRLKEELHCVRKDTIKGELTEGEKFANMSMEKVEEEIDKLAGEKLT